MLVKKDRPTASMFEQTLAYFGELQVTVVSVVAEATVSCAAPVPEVGVHEQEGA